MSAEHKPQAARDESMVSSRLLKGRCPMGCGRTLFVGDGGYVTCSYERCPAPASAYILLETAPVVWALKESVERVAREVTEAMSGV